MSNAIEQAYELGWRRSAEWSKRDDLLLDIGSPAYERYRGEDLAHLYAQAQVRMTDAKEAFFREYPGAYEEFDLPGIQALWRCWQSSWNAARLSQGAQGAQGEASKPHSYRWRRHGRDEWHWAEWIPISDDEVSEMRTRGWDVEVLYTHPDKLNKPALVGHTQFGIGIAWSTVIGAAQRAYEWKDDKMSPEQIAAFYIAFPHLAPSHEKVKQQEQPAERLAVPDGLVSAARRALAEYRKLQPKVVFDLGAFDELEAMLTAAPKPPEGARVVDKEES